MKTFLSLFLSALLAVGAITFNGTTTTAVSGTNATLEAVTSWTTCVWMYPVGMGEGSAGRIMEWGIPAGTGRWQMLITGTQTITASVLTSGTTRSAASNNSVFSLNTWVHVCGSYTASDGGPRIYVGTATTSSAEISYASRTDGSGTTNTATGAVIYVGNRNDGDRTFDGRIAEARFFSRALSITEINTVRLGYGMSGAVGIWSLYGNNTSTGVDTSGNAINLTLTNATAGDHAPIAPAFGWWR